ncbi:MAG: flavin reductase family protein [Candidatus Woesearchaeota archaeon]
MVDIVGPQQAILITSRAEIEELGKKIEKDEIDTTCWHMPVSMNEHLYAIAIHNSKNINKIIQKSKIFVINFLGFDMEHKFIMCDKLHGQHINKFNKLELIKINAEHVESFYIKEACAILECEVQNMLEFADYTVYIAKSINSKGFYDIKRLFHLKKDIFTTTKT